MLLRPRFPLKFLQMKTLSFLNQKKKKKKWKREGADKEAYISFNNFISAKNSGISPDKSFFDKSLSIRHRKQSF